MSEEMEWNSEADGKIGFPREEGNLIHSTEIVIFSLWIQLSVGGSREDLW